MDLTVGEIVTAAMMNAQVRDNLQDLDARTQVIENLVNSTESTSSTSYTDMATVGPALTIVTGSRALVTISAQMRGVGNTVSAYMSVAVSGATTIAASDIRKLKVYSPTSADQHDLGTTFVMNLNHGSNTFTAKYRCGDAAKSGEFGIRRLTVMPASKIS